jgi:hypothetical protein
MKVFGNALQDKNIGAYLFHIVSDPSGVGICSVKLISILVLPATRCLQTGALYANFIDRVI